MQVLVFSVEHIADVIEIFALEIGVHRRLAMFCSLVHCEGGWFV